MKSVLKIISFISLFVTISPAFMAMAGVIDDETYKNWMLIGTIGWFMTAPFWIFGKNEKSDN